MPGRVDLYYDIVSPYTFLGFELLCRYRLAWRLDCVQLRPVLLGAVLAGAGTKVPPGGIPPAKAAYVGKDLPRLARHYALPMRLDLESPRLHELMFRKGSLQAMRYLTAVQAMSLRSPDAVEALTRELFLRLFARHQDVSEPVSLLEAAASAGLTKAEAIEALEFAGSEVVKSRLKATTDEALSLGAFGSPTFVVHTAGGGREMVFGSDRFHVIGDLLSHEYLGPLNHLSTTSTA